MSDIIQLLPDHVANQIAAGEVVQRPASVVKELLENAIDAKATSIKLLIKDAGRTLIQVIDNGIGMSQTDARMSFERHATSKITSANDLYNLHTKGFRGEALASIAAIAQVELKTKQEEDDLGVILKIEGSDLILQELTSTPKGTSIAVKNLFFNIPARRNFLKSNAVETKHIINEFQRVALAHPSIAFSLYHNDNEVYFLKGENLRQRITSIFGKKINDKLVPINETTDLVKITGFVTTPKFAKKTKGAQFFFANNRFIKSPYLNHAINKAYEGLISHGNHPSFYIFLEVDAKTIDINIHPTKTEIKFENESDIYAIIRATVKHSLGQYNIAPLLDFDRDSTMDIPYKYKDIAKKTPYISVNPEFNPFTSDTNYTPQKQPNWETLYANTKNTGIESDFTENEETTLFEEAKEIHSTKTVQIQRKYIISSLKKGMLVIKQNLAHQRILYERLLEKTTNNVPAIQQLLIPMEIDFNKQDVGVLFETKEELEKIGFQFNEFRSDGVILDGIPAIIEKNNIVSVLEEIIDTIRLETSETVNLLEIAIKGMAKSMAIKTGKKLNSKEQEEIINQLFSCSEPNYSPYGKAIFTNISLDEIEKHFN